MSIIKESQKEPEMVETNVGAMPVRDYREIVAIQYGFGSYDEMYKAGFRIGNGYDKVPESSNEKIIDPEHNPVWVKDDFNPLIQAFREAKNKESELTSAKKHCLLYEALGKDVNYDAIGLPVRLRTEISELNYKYNEQQYYKQKIAEVYCPVEPKGLFVSKAKKEQYAQEYATYKATVAPLYEAKMKVEKCLQKSFDALAEYLHPDDILRPGMGCDASVIDPVNMTQVDIIHLGKAVNHRIENKHDGYQMIADREKRFADAKEAVSVAQNALDLAQARYNTEFEKIPAEYRNKAREVIKAEIERNKGNKDKTLNSPNKDLRDR